MPSMRMMGRAMGLEVKFIIVFVILVFVVKACGSNGQDKATLEALGPEPERVFLDNCRGGYLRGAASSELAVQKGELDEVTRRKINGYASEYDFRISKEVVKPSMTEYEAISAAEMRCMADLERYKTYQKSLSRLKAERQ